RLLGGEPPARAVRARGSSRLDRFRATLLTSEQLGSSRAGLRELWAREQRGRQVLRGVWLLVRSWARAGAGPAQDGDGALLRPHRLHRPRRDARSRAAACAARPLLR